MARTPSRQSGLAAIIMGLTTLLSAAPMAPAAVAADYTPTAMCTKYFPLVGAALEVPCDDAAPDIAAVTDPDHDERVRHTGKSGSKAVPAKAAPAVTEARPEPSRTAPARAVEAPVKPAASVPATSIARPRPPEPIEVSAATPPPAANVPAILQTAAAPPAKRRPTCHAIIERAQLGDLSDDERLILQKECR